MGALIKRFETVTLNVWARLGIRPVGFWTTLVGESNHDLTYLLEWESLEERDRKWAAFQTDAEWISKRAESEKEHPIVASISNSILQPTKFSLLK